VLIAVTAKVTYDLHEVQDPQRQAVLLHEVELEWQAEDRSKSS
jgi:hypothetical protein